MTKHKMWLCLKLISVYVLVSRVVANSSYYFITVHRRVVWYPAAADPQLPANWRCCALLADLLATHPVGSEGCDPPPRRTLSRCTQDCTHTHSGSIH